VAILIDRELQCRYQYFMLAPLKSRTTGLRLLAAFDLPNTSERSPQSVHKMRLVPGMQRMMNVRGTRRVKFEPHSGHVDMSVP
jgi:hypothetical protein